MTILNTIGYAYSGKIWMSNIMRAFLNLPGIPIPELLYPAGGRIYTISLGHHIIVSGSTKMGADTDSIMYLYAKDNPQQYTLFLNEVARAIAANDNWVKFYGS